MFARKYLNVVIVTAIVFLSFKSVYSQGMGLDNWKVYTSLANVTQTSCDSLGRIWAATTGGVFIYDTKLEIITEIRKIEGLKSLNITSIKFNPNDKKMYIGSADGWLHMVTEDMQWTYNSVIFNEKFSNSEIKDFVFLDDDVFIAGGFGLAKLNPADNVFIEDAKRLGNFPTGTYINELHVFDGYLWAATDEGIARNSLAESISNPNTWETYSTNEGISQKSIYHLIDVNDTLYASSEKFILQFLDSMFIELETREDWAQITGMINIDGLLAYSHQLDIFKLGSISFQVNNTELINSINYFVMDSLKAIVINYQRYGFRMFMESDTIHVLPNTPYSNHFVNLDVDSKGRLWAATKYKDGAGSDGFMMLDEKNQWTNFNYASDTIIGNSCLNVKSVTNGRVFVSNWGEGLYIVTDSENGFAIDTITSYNSPLTGAITKSQDYAITGPVLQDESGLIWIVNYGESYPGPLLLALDRNGNYSTFENLIDPNERQFLEFTIDQYGTKWLGSNKFTKGLYYFNENGTLADKTDDVYGKLTKTNSEILDNEQTALAADKSGFIWIGTNSGLNFIYDSYPALTGGKISVSEERTLKGYYIRDIYIDALNNKWIATTKGLWILNDDASEPVYSEILNSSNTPLIDDDVYSITSDPKTGVMYFGTANGLITAQSLAAMPAETYEISCYPQPFDPHKDAKLVIDGLEENSDIRILTHDGVLVKELTAEGRIVYWDGRDEFGNIASNGVYLIVGSSESAGSGAVGKFAILRK